MSQQSDFVKPLLDTVSLVTVAGTLMNILPAIAAVLSIIWTVVRIYETDTVQKILGKKPIKGGKDTAQE